MDEWIDGMEESGYDDDDDACIHHYPTTFS
jgi:hypothetical protein